MADIHTNARTFLSARFRRMSDEQCQRIHAQHEPEPLPEDVTQRIKDIVRRSEERLGG
jgi:phosphoribosylaminoimidazole-succinocarboxamide synthase